MKKHKKKSSKSAHPVDDQIFEQIDPEFSKKLEPFLEGLWKHYFRCEISGWENVPKQKALFVGNHNGLLTFELFMLFHAWKKHFGDTKKALGLAHGIVIKNPLFKWLGSLGAIPASPEVADEAFKRDYSLLVYPGGEKESFRPYKERKKINFYQRKGFLKVAWKNKVPIVPVVSIGAHESYVILSRGEGLAEALGLKQKLRLHGLPITYRSIFFLWCVATGLFTGLPLLLAPWAFLSIFVPLPAKMTFRVLPPIELKEIWDYNKSDDENYQIAYDIVIERMQAVLTEEYKKRRFPVLG